MDQFEKHGHVDFPYSSPYYTFNISIYANGDIKLGKRLIRQNDINSLSLKDGNLVVSYKSKEKNDNRMEFELGLIGNSLILLEMLRRTQKKMLI